MSEKMPAITAEKQIVYYANDPEVINTLSQVRKSIDASELLELVEAIEAEGGLINPLTVAMLDVRHASKYIEYFNEVHGSQHSAEALNWVEIKGKGKVCLVLIAGHRRLAALKQIRVRNPELQLKIPMHTEENINPERAMRIQITENTHTRVPAAQEADTLVAYMRMLEKKRGRKMTFSELAKLTGRGEDTLRAAYRFKSLPESLQKFAFSDESPVAYGILVQIARLQEFHQKINDPLDEKEMLALLQFARIGKYTVPEFTKHISARIEHLSNGDQSLFANTMQINERVIRQIFEREVHKGLLAFASYLQQIVRDIDAGLFDMDARFNGEPSARLIAKIFKVLQEDYDAFARLAENSPQEGRVMLTMIDTVLQATKGK